MASERPLPVLYAVTRGLCWSVVLALAVVGVLFVGAPSLVLAAVGACSAAAIDGAVRQGRRPDLPRRQRLARAMRVAGIGLAAVLALCGLAGMLGVAAVPAALVIGALGLALRRMRRGPAVPGDGRGTDLLDLDDRALGREWAVSYAELGRSRRDPLLLDQVVMRRRLLLDEIERRHPEGFRRWAHTGDWVRSDTVPFLGT